MYKEIAVASLVSLSVFSAASFADDPATPSNPIQTPDAVVISSAVDASCFAEAAAEALVWSQGNWWRSLGYRSAVDWFAAALGYAVAGLSANAKFDVTSLNDGGAERLDFNANISGATLVLAATTAKNSASRFARTWRDDWTYNQRYTGVTWVSGQAKAGRRTVGGGTGAGTSGTGTTIGNVVSITGTHIDEFRNHLTLNAEAWSLAASESYAGLFDRAAATMGRRISARFAVAAGKALATAVANTALLADVNVHYKTQEGRVVIDDTQVNVSCGAGAEATSEGYAADNPDNSDDSED
jgi:hypothetical protein